MKVVESVEKRAITDARQAPAREWWRGAVIYQIYPRSFRDTNGDGVGDLNGVIEGLDYVASLGVDGVWLSPFFTSPMRDFGYDVADYCNVDPVFGTLADFDRLIAKAHLLGLKVIIDQVFSHTSDEHAWFAESRRCAANPKADWYVWADPRPDGSPPCNWQSVFGGAAWTWDSRRRQYYLHNFLSSQPDLNLHNREVQDALLDTARFWLERGVDGFRLDALNFSMHDPLLRDNPPAPRDGRRITRPFDLQIHKYNQSHPDIPKFLERVRRLTNEYAGVFTVAEVGGPEPLTEMKAFTASDRRLNSAYSFDFLYADELTASLLEDALAAWPGLSGEGWPSWAFSNHDAPRALSRWAAPGDLAAAARLYLMLLMSLRGNVFVYQGEELGLPQAEVPFERLQDPEAIANWPMTLGRDGARTPLPWAAKELNAGFSSGSPWLPIDPRHVGLAIDAQADDPHSILSFARKLIASRRASPALKFGGVEILDAPDGVFALKRASEEEEAVCVFNLGDAPVEIHFIDVDGFEVVVGVGTDRLPKRLDRLSGFIAVRKA
jgi:alpha-glucosidase